MDAKVESKVDDWVVSMMIPSSCETKVMRSRLPLINNLWQLDQRAQIELEKALMGTKTVHDPLEHHHRWWWSCENRAVFVFDAKEAQLKNFDDYVALQLDVDVFGAETQLN